MTLGEYRVGVDFNPSKNPEVDKLKRAAADFIDLVGYSHQGDPEVLRLKALAITHAEDAAMWAVKAVTKKPMDNPAQGRAAGSTTIPWY